MLHGSMRAAEWRYRQPYRSVHKPITGGNPEQRSIDSDGADPITCAVHGGPKRALRVISNATIDKLEKPCIT
jgi:hypothetical protein